MNGQFELGAVSPRRYFVVVAMVFGLLFGLIVDPDPGIRAWGHLLQWQVQTGVPMALLVGSHLLLHRFTWFEARRPWLRLILSGTIGVLVTAPMLHAADVLMAVDSRAAQGWWWGAALEVLDIGPPILVAWLAINAPWVWGLQLVHRTANAEPNPSTPSGKPCAMPTGFLSQLPPSLGIDLISLKAELHYLTVATTRGRTLVLYNLKDAVAELDPALGYQCHRSYWVAGNHIVSLRKSGRQGTLRLSDGSEIPVSRSRFAEIEARLATNDHPVPDQATAAVPTPSATE